jgi:ABC-type antimicrobial peptide transport system permease subunit
MIKNYLKIAWRNLTRNRVYSAINILGLALGMSIVLLIGAWIHDELSFNKSFPNHARIAMVMHNSIHGGRVDTRRSCPAPLAAGLRTAYAADLESVVLCSFFDAHSLQVGNADPVSSVGIHSEPGFPALFSFNMTRGTADLTDPASMLISQSTAKILFANADPLGQTIKVDNKGSLRVTGVYEDMPDNSDWKALNYIINWHYFESSQSWVRDIANEWNANSFMILTELRPGRDMMAVSTKVAGALNGHARNDKPEVLLQPLDRWHLYSDFKDGRNAGGGIRYVWMFGTIGIFVLLLACINFMNLSTARSEKRAREVGIRKSIGSSRRQLLTQFLGESVLLAGLAAVLALLLAKVSLPSFGELAGSRMHLDLSAGFLSFFLGFTLLVGLLAGSYPALYLSSFNAVKVLKGSFKTGSGGALPRKVLTVLQFTVSISLIIGTIIIFRQIEYVKNRPVGYEREGLLTVRMNTDDLYKHFDAIRDELKQSGAVTDITQTTSTTTGMPWQQSGFNWAGRDPNITPLFDVVFTNFEYGRTVGWQVVKGRDFSREMLTDSSAIVINEAAVSYLGFKEPIGKTVNYLYSNRTDNRYRIIGVVKDMVMQSPEEKVHPAIFMVNLDNSAWILVKTNPKMPMSSAMPLITGVFHKYNPGAPFDYQFSSEAYAEKFKSEDRVLQLAVFFTIFAILISCLGLFGLASFMAEQRVREIGVRKILGASVPQLWGLLSRDFVVLVGISWLIALPLSWYGMTQWLRGYDYRTAISPWIFVYTLGVALVITMITVSYQAIRASLANPVKSLRSE